MKTNAAAETRHSVFLAVALIFLPVTLPAAVRTWDGTGGDNNASTPANWVGDTAPVADDDIVLDGTTNRNMTWDLNIRIASWTQIGYDGTATVATVYGTAGFTNLNISGDCTISNGVWTHIGNSSTEANRLSVFVGGDLTVGPNGVIDADGIGYATRYGPGGYNASGMRGACHGGRGADTYGYLEIKKYTYGSVVAPTNLGSGGYSRAGGGAVCLTVSGQTRIDGQVTANAQSNYNYYAGSGGSIWITSGTLTGSGAIYANGGMGGNAPGGGGRIALKVTNGGADFSAFTGVSAAYGGLNGTTLAAGPGTVYRETQADAPGNGELIIDNNGRLPYGGVDDHACLGDLETVTYEFSRITLTNNGVLIVASNNTLTVTSTDLRTDPSSLNDGISIDGGGTLAVPDTFAYSNYFILVSDSMSDFHPATLLTIRTNAVFYVNQPYVMTNDLIVEAGGSLSHSPNYTSEVFKIDLTINGNLTVRTGGCVDVTARGYKAQEGPGTGAAGGYGGRANIPWNLTQAGWCYGSIVAPTNLGSGGNGSAGGGAVLLKVSGAVTNKGLMCADGGTSTYYTGSGGTIYLIAGTLVGGGTIRANGGYPNGTSGIGGGGRVALVVTNAAADFSSYTGPIQAFGGRAGAGAGTIHLRTAAQEFNTGTLIIDNNSMAGKPTEINTNVTDTVMGDVVIRNSGYLLLETNQTLTLSGVWSNAASSTGYTDSAVIFAGPAGSTSIVYGSTAFMGIFCTNTTTKTILFQAGVTNSVDDMGRLKLNGGGTTNLFLRSTSAGTPWNLNVAGSVDQSVSCVDVRDSDAMPGIGAPIIAMNSMDSGGNTNWVFVEVSIGETNIWTGNSNTAWSLSANWNLGRPPIEDDFILIPGSRPRYPVLDDDRTVNGIDIESGASLDLAGYNLTVTTNAVMAGTLTASGTATITFRSDAVVSGTFVASGTETIVFQGDLDFSGGSFASANSTVVFSGGSAQSVNLANLAYNRIDVLNSADTVTLVAGFSAVEFRCEAPAGQRHITFQQGATVTLRDLILLGATATTNIILRSSSVGQKWMLNVTGYQSVNGVDVQDSDASPGQTITATSSKNSSGNLNWVFESTWATWMGTNSTSFHDASNWSPPAIPGSSSRVLAENGNPMAITSAVSLLDLTVGGGAQQATVTAYASVTIGEDIVVLTNGTLALNRPSIVSNGLYVLTGGMLTHSGPQTTESNKLDVTVYGNLSVDMDAFVDVKGKGYGKTDGPGNTKCGGSYGGQAWETLSSQLGPCYGSIVAPTNLGSGGNSHPGGGAVLLNVSGQMRIDGVVSADGGDYISNGYAGSGGSIWIVSGTLIGIGIIRADGGDSAYQGAGAGGRIALVVTNAGSDFLMHTGPVTTFGGTGGYGGYSGGAGTIYKAVGGCPTGQGIVVVDNDNMNGRRYTDVPPVSPGNVPGEVDHATFCVTNGGILRLTITNDFMMGDLYLSSANSVLDLNTNTLSVNSFIHDIDPGVVTNYGQIIWYRDPDGTIFMGW